MAEWFASGGSEHTESLLKAFSGALPAAEAELDRLAAEAKQAAVENTADPTLLYTLVDYTRALSMQ